LDSKRLVSILENLGLSRGGFALLLGATRKSGENWTAPGAKVPPPVATVAELLDRRPEVLTILREINPDVPPARKRGRRK
jgi:DNA-binding transcriptional regulator YiaG